MRRRITALLLGVAAFGATLTMGQQAVTATPAKSDQENYTVRIRTGTQIPAGTDARVWLYVNGTDANFGPFELGSAGTQLDRDTIYDYRFTADLGEIQRICLIRDDSGPSPSWFVRSVTLERTFIFNKWIPSEDWTCES